MENKRKHTIIDDDDDDENHIQKKLKPDVVEVIDEYATGSVELVTQYDERPVAPLDEDGAFDYGGIVAHMSGNPDDGTLSGYFGNNEGDESVTAENYFDLETLDSVPRDYSNGVPSDELIYAANVVNENGGYLENVNAWNCDPAISHAYCWNNEESVVPGDDIIDLTMDDDIITITSSSEFSTTIASTSQQDCIFNLDDDTDSDDSSSTGTRSGIG